MRGHLVDTTEMYLKSVYELEEEGVPPLRARLVERLGQSKPTVSETVARMERDGLMSLDGRAIVLSEEGRLYATQVMRKHRLAERLLLDVIRIPWEDVHEEACRWEHVISDETEQKIAELLGYSRYDPYGNPIPEYGTAGPMGQTAAENGLINGREFLAQNPDGGIAILARIGEILQTDTALLRSLREARIVPGADVTIFIEGARPVICAAGCVELSPWMARHLQLQVAR
ncbi:MULTISPECIES: metal-dependent transcriptional regulator [unclassified Actinobaculum]|uniref:metal-dependent transcriptional regulator n=1 Tax=unclassified Actinobaculum TaxID=2609299 RepID=UPI000D528D05|nr:MULTISPECIES: metal-dependent transcriptional regulator [unclassified Actinobaculum]AWE41675.1 metal-dependent transcriptional regulator [Actinobaculum sp. 313]RTE49295.1 metal-dependent transcriptional regulator [Actinobaculum sp. 352]